MEILVLFIQKAMKETDKQMSELNCIKDAFHTYNLPYSLSPLLASGLHEVLGD